MRISKYILSLLLIVAISSCDDYLAGPEPEQSLQFEGELQTAEEVQDMLTGLYNDIQAGNITGSQSRFFSEIMTSNVGFDGSFTTYQDIQALDMDAGNGDIQNLWDDYYVAINTANLLIRDAGSVEDAPGFDAQEVIGQARFLRGWLYFSAVRYFALPWSTGNNSSSPGIPIVTEPVSSPEDFGNPERSSVAEVYDRAVTDIQAAINNLPARVAQGRANEFVATAMLARIRLNQQDYQDAADLAGDVIANGGYQLDGGVTTIFRNEFTGESIFEVAHTLQDNPGINNSLPAFYAPDGRDDTNITTDFFGAANSIITSSQQTALDAANFTAEDTRITELMSTQLGTDPTVIEPGADNTLKYEDGTNTADNAVILRLPEMMLTRAEGLTREAANLAAVPQEAFDLVNQIRRRAIIVTDDNGNQVDESVIDYGPADFANKQEFIDKILLERRVELAFEGERLFDLLRTQQNVQGQPYDADFITMPIPQSEIDANANLDQEDQNPHYQ